MVIKDDQIHFRLPGYEKEVIMQAAKEAGQPLSDYAREVLLAASNYQSNEVVIQGQIERDAEEKEILESHSIRTSKREWEFYNEQAKLIGCSVSDYIRQSADGNSITIIPGMKEVAKQIAKVGANLNQLTVLAHQGRIKEADLYATNDTLKQILKELIKLTRKGG